MEEAEGDGETLEAEKTKLKEDITGLKKDIEGLEGDLKKVRIKAKHNRFTVPACMQLSIMFFLK